jgi:H+/Cl- antiporter ClcA
MNRPRLPLKSAPELTQYLRMGIRTYRDRLLVQGSFWFAAIATGVAAVLFAKLITWVQAWQSGWYDAHPYLGPVLTPIAFVAAVGVVRFFGPAAGGSGVPQVLYATEVVHEKDELSETDRQIISIRTIAVKVASTCLGFFGGASIGGEGPTVQIAAAIFGTAGSKIRKLFPDIDFHSYLVAAAGAGIGAAFNTPLGGVAFALEEFALGEFGPLRHLVLLAVIATGLTAQALIGDELYFGHPDLHTTAASHIYWAILIGVGGGLMGGLFGRILIWRGWERLKVAWWKRALIFGVAAAVIAIVFRGWTSGSGYNATREIFEGRAAELPLMFPVAKLLATAFSTLSGMGGGILAPSLSIGAWTGVTIGKIAAFGNLPVCALLGMTAYFTGAFQIPITAIIVCMEMTNEHDVIFPMMISALAAFAIARVLMPVPLYHVLIERWTQREYGDPAHKPSGLPLDGPSGINKA